MNQVTETAAPRQRFTRGFSLIEVLIAVLVLGVGLLGVATVFPVVISQQREATDVIRGGVASSAVQSEIRSNPDIAQELLSQDGFVDRDETDADGDRCPNDPDDRGEDVNNDGVPDGFATKGDGEPVFGEHPQFNPAFPVANETRFNPLTGYSYLWEADWNWGATYITDDNRNIVPVGANLLASYVMDGGMRFRDPEERQDAGVGNNVADLPVLARLYPRPYSIEGSTKDGPLYVWDFVPRRTPRGGVQIVVFLRRIDNGIQIPSGETLSAVLADSAAMRVFPVGRDMATGLPTLNGTGEYSVPVSAAAEAVPSGDYPFRPEFREFGDPTRPLLDGVRVTISMDSEIGTAQFEEELSVLADVGQRFVDNLGVVRTVVEVLGGTGSTVDLRVTPAYSLNSLSPGFADTLPDFALLEAARASKLRQIVFTPQKPVDVFTMEFNQ